MQKFEETDQTVKLLKSLVAIDSTTGNELKITNYLSLVLEKNGFDVIRQRVSKNRYNLLATKNANHDSKAIMFLGHLDTVDTKGDSGWQTNPLQLTLSGDRLYGLGASDMKAGVAAMVDASKDSDAYIKLILTVDEENISEGSWVAIRKAKNFFKDVSLVISAEPGLGNGPNMIATGRTGRCIFEVEFVGVSEHILNYKKAVDAIEMLSLFTVELYKKRLRLFKDKETVIQVRKVEGEAVGMSVCGLAKLQVEVLLGPGDSILNVQSALQKLAGKNKVSLVKRKTPYLEGYNFKSIPHLKELTDVVKKHTNKDPEFYFRRSVADDNVIASLGIPVITWGPEGGNEHKANEYVKLTSLIRLRDMYSDFLNLVK